MFTFFKSPIYNKLFKTLFFLYVAFSALLLFRSSVVGLDNQRHYILFDDAMISMRYADNLVKGNGLVWNIGEKIEGFTNPLMVGIMAGVIKIFGQNYSALAIQIIGLLCLIINVFLVIKITKYLLYEKEDTDFLIFTSALLTMTWYPVIYWSIFGMETGILTTLVLFSVYLSLTNKRRGVDILIALVLSLIYLARPESIIFIFFYYIFRLIQKINQKNEWLFVLVEGIVTAIPIVGYQIFRLQYFGENFPNTYLLKATGMPLIDRLKNGIGFYEPFLHRIDIIVFIVLLFFFIFLFEAHKSLYRKINELLIGKYSFLIFFFILFISYSAYQIYMGGDPWPPFWRMTVPYTLLMFIAFIIAASELKSSLKIKDDIFQGIIALVVFSFIAFIPFDYHYDFTRLEPYQTRNNIENLNSALVIKEITKNEAVIASFYAGTIPYLTERYSLDPLGKMDKHIASLPPDLSGTLSNPRGLYSIPGHNKYDLNYTLKEKRPDVIVYLAFNNHICSWAKQNLEEWCYNNYKLVTYKGVKILLWKDSQNILWEKVTPKN